MILRVCTFTGQGETLAHEMFKEWQEMIPQYREKGESLEEWTGECFRKHLPILFVGASGIAVRAIAPFVKDKLSDSAVLVMDEKGRYVIPLLSGHVGGANELAHLLAKKVGATPVITTATDAEGLFSVDVFAKENGLQIHNREGIRLVSGKLLRGDGVTITWEEGVEVLGKDHEVVDAAKAILPNGLTYISFEEEYVDVRIVTRQGLANAQEGRQGLLLVAKEYVIGMGCKKGKGFEELKAFLEGKALKGWEENTHAIATIDLKAREEGLWELAQFYHLPLALFSGEELEKVPGDFEESNFVREITGVGNVCERAALCCAGDGGEILLRKVSENGMTLAMAKRKVRLRFD